MVRFMSKHFVAVYIVAMFQNYCKNVTELK